MVDTATNQYYYFFYFSTVYSEYFYFCVEPPSLFLRPLQRWQFLYAELGHRVQRHQAHQKHLPDRQVQPHQAYQKHLPDRQVQYYSHTKLTRNISQIGKYSTTATPSSPETSPRQASTGAFCGALCSQCRGAAPALAPAPDLAPGVKLAFVQIFVCLKTRPYYCFYSLDLSKENKKFGKKVLFQVS